MHAALEELAVSADEVADDQRRVARRARAMNRQRERGRSWAEILDGESEPRLLGLLRGNTRRLAEATGRLAHTLAQGLVREGESRRQIARRLGVTHQRISAMLRHSPHPAPPQDASSDG
jgi:hypothetical protein